jgi:hypothetical protein
MLVVQDFDNPTDVHSFILSDEHEVTGKIQFTLESDTYPGAKIDLTLESAIFPIPPNYSVSIHLFKNAFLSQNDIVDLRVNGLVQNSGKIGLAFRLDALFEPNILQFTEHNFGFAVYALRKLFGQGVDIQNKTNVFFNGNPLKITEFFDENTILVVLCNEFCNNIPDFSLDKYLTHLYLNGFIIFDKSNPVKALNNSVYIQDKVRAFKGIKNNAGNPVLKVPAANAFFENEFYARHLFKNLIQKDNEAVTRFILLYQVIEIAINKVLIYNVNKDVITKLSSLTGKVLIDLLDNVKKEKTRVSNLLHLFARPDGGLEIDMATGLCAFYTHINDPDLGTVAQQSGKSMADLFYAYRNKIVHNYRSFHQPVNNQQITDQSMQQLNEMTEVLIAYILTYYKEP